MAKMQEGEGGSKVQHFFAKDRPVRQIFTPAKYEIQTDLAMIALG